MSILVKRELQAKYYGSKDLYKYLDDIVIKSSDGTKRIIELFQEMGLYKLAETAIDQEGDVDQEYKIANLLMKYDPDNIIGWLMKWKISTIVRDIIIDENIIRLAKDSENQFMKKGYIHILLSMGLNVMHIKSI